MMHKLIATSLLVAATAQAIYISTPGDVAQCSDVTFNVGDTNGPIYFSVVNSVNPCQTDALFESAASFTGNTYTWKAALPVGTTVYAYIDDDGSQEGWSGAFKIVEGNGACLTAAAAPAPEAVSSSTTAAPAAPTPSTTSTTSTSRSTTTSRTTTRGGSGDEVANAIQTAGTDGAPEGSSGVITSTSLFSVLAAAGLVALAL